MFNTEQELIEFLESHRNRERWNSDYGISSLLSFPYTNSRLKVIACETIISYVDDRVNGSQGSIIELNRYIVAIAAFMEQANYQPAISALIRFRNKVLSEVEDIRPGCYAHEMIVAVENSIESLQKNIQLSTEINNSLHDDKNDDDLEKIVEVLNAYHDGCGSMLRKAHEYSSSDPNASIVKTRQLFEKVIISAYTRIKHVPKRAAINSILCDSEFTSRLERRVLARMRHLQELGNIAAHGHEVISKDSIRALEDLHQVIKWFLADDSF